MAVLKVSALKNHLLQYYIAAFKVSIHGITSKKLHFIPSDPSCDSLDCKYYSYCTVPPSGIATCKCPDPAACGASKNRVCGTDGLTYDNICQLTSEACKRYHEVRVQHAGLCIRK